MEDMSKTIAEAARGFDTDYVIHSKVEYALMIALSDKSTRFPFGEDLQKKVLAAMRLTAAIALIINEKGEVNQ